MAFSDVNVQRHATLDDMVCLISFGNSILTIAHFIMSYERTELLLLVLG